MRYLSQRPGLPLFTWQKKFQIFNECEEPLLGEKGSHHRCALLNALERAPSEDPAASIHGAAHDP